MEIALKNNMLLIRSDFASINLPWMYEFIEHHIKDIIFLPRAILILNNDSFDEKKESFLFNLSEHYSYVHDFSKEFFYKSMLLYHQNPIKLDITKLAPSRLVTVRIKVNSPSEVQLLLSRPNKWVIAYLRAQLENYIIERGSIYMLLNMRSNRAKEKLEHTFSKNCILHVSINYKFDNDFVQKLYGTFKAYDNLREESAVKELEYKHYYSILECPVGASSNDLKRSYKKLVKMYHPDKIYSQDDSLIHEQTQKFQLLQEAYNALKIVS
ncbi:MAG: J domain-containing protein [Campylobacterota bacterium]|nr:J domain-containing protein [Campylobacterota bacterium]